jgi:peptide chain release factor 1
LSSGDSLSNSKLAELGKEMSDLTPLITLMQKRSDVLLNIADLRSVEMEERAKGVEGEEMANLAVSEREEIEKELAAIENDIIKLLIPQDKDNDRNIILEVRAGTGEINDCTMKLSLLLLYIYHVGGDEASLFAGEMFKMYQKYALLMNWKWEELSLSRTEIGGFKEAQAHISGELVYKYLKYEAGVHRVQRIPVNDTKIQTSAASVIVMPEAGDLDIDIRPGDIKVDVFRSGGAGGQSVNKTESAVRMTHIPTGIVVVMQVLNRGMRIVFYIILILCLFLIG